ncbi:alpha,alpha-trehalose phosphorylase [Streptomyces sp. LamerLS-31b]|nr:alpha,alpha-trehalose phosphorylase [Streptomyces sp. LamerLS-31b]
MEIDADKTTYELLDGPPLDLRHHGDAVTVTMSEPAVRPVPPGPRRALPQQPRHRVPNQAS